MNHQNYFEHFMAKLSDTFSNYYVFLDRIIVALGIFIVFIFLAWISGRFFRKITAKYNQRTAVTFGRLVRNLFLIIGVFAALNGAGVKVSGLLTGLGLAALAIGYGMQYIFANIGAGFMVMLTGEIRKGDHITIYGNEGTVTNITLRYTTLQNGNKTVLVPNNLFLTYPTTKTDKTAN